MGIFFNIIFGLAILIVIYQLLVLIALKGYEKRFNKQVTIADLEAFSKFLDKILWIPNHPFFWGKIRFLYQEVLFEESIDRKLKSKLYYSLKKKNVYGLTNPDTINFDIK